MTRNAHLLSLLLAATVATSSVQAQGLGDLVDSIFGGGGDDNDEEGGGNGTDTSSGNTLGDALQDIADALDEVINDTVENFNETLPDGTQNVADTIGEIIGANVDVLNDTLPDNNIDIDALFELPTFANFTFVPGGNCSICDVEGGAPLEGFIDGLPCMNWEVVAFSGIQQGSDQCNLLRVVAVEHCGCPMPAENEGKTCSLCPEGQEPAGILLNTLAVSCSDLTAAPAVDGDATCASVTAVEEQCNCQAVESTSSEGSDGSTSAGNENEVASGSNTEGEDDTSGPLGALQDLFDTLDDVIGEAVASLNDTLPDEIGSLFELPTFENYTFIFGGSCVVCDVENTMYGNIDGLMCNDWEVVAFLGIQEGSDQCNLLRVAAVEYCGCPMPTQNVGKTCSVCPEGQEPALGNGALFNTLAVSCTDLTDAPAVDGDATCASISTVTQQCNCQAVETVSGGSGGGSSGTSSTNGDYADGDETSSARGKQSVLSFFFLAIGFILGV